MDRRDAEIWILEQLFATGEAVGPRTPLDDTLSGTVLLLDAQGDVRDRRRARFVCQLAPGRTTLTLAAPVTFIVDRPGTLCAAVVLDVDRSRQFPVTLDRNPVSVGDEIRIT